MSISLRGASRRDSAAQINRSKVSNVSIMHRRGLGTNSVGDIIVMSITVVMKPPGGKKSASIRLSVRGPYG